jgi:pantetheine-phosphate adenylyltransferase
VLRPSKRNHSWDIRLCLLRQPGFFLVNSGRDWYSARHAHGDLSGSFDPLTNGHLDVIQRAAKLFDRVVVAVAKSESKQPLFTLEERLALVKQAVADIRNVEADAFEGLLIHYVEQRGAQAIVRGLRAVSDFEFEFQLALMNRKLNERIETIFMMPKDTYTFLSSRIVKEIAKWAAMSARLFRRMCGRNSRRSWPNSRRPGRTSWHSS